jgi:Ca2+-binding RTX toxin-like protein
MDELEISQRPQIQRFSTPPYCFTHHKKVENNVWESADGVYRYQQFSFGGINDLAIGRGSKVLASQMQGSIVIKGWTGTGLGLTLSSSMVTQPQPQVFNGDTLQPDGIDVIFGTANRDEINGLAYNDALDGSAGDDEIDGGAGDDLIAGGSGSDKIKGGAGNDYIFGAGSVTAPARAGSSDQWPAVGHPLPSDAIIVTQGKTWGVYTVPGQSGGTTMTIYGINAGQDTAPDIIDAGDGDDHVYGSRGADYIEGGLGIDEIFGGGGGDIIEGGDDRDYIWGDGQISVNSYSYTVEVDHGAINDLVISRESKAGCCNSRFGRVKSSSKLTPFYVGRGPIRFANCSKRLQYTLNGYFERRFCHSSKRALTNIHVEARSS